MRTRSAGLLLKEKMLRGTRGEGLEGWAVSRPKPADHPLCLAHPMQAATVKHSSESRRPRPRPPHKQLVKRHAKLVCESSCLGFAEGGRRMMVRGVGNISSVEKV